MKRKAFETVRDEIAERFADPAWITSSDLARADDDIATVFGFNDADILQAEAGLSLTKKAVCAILKPVKPDDNGRMMIHVYQAYL